MGIKTLLTDPLLEENRKVIEVLGRYSQEKLDPLQYFDKFYKPQLMFSDKEYTEPLYLDFEDYNYLHDTSVLNHIYLNDFDFNLEEDRERIKELTRMEFEGNTFDTVAKCRCIDNPLRGNYLLNSNRVCGKCGSKVELFLDKGQDSNLWIRTPEGVNKFVSISFYNTFFTSITMGTPTLILPQYFLDSKYRRDFHKRSNQTTQTVLRMLEELKINKVDLNTFVERCDDIMFWILKGDGLRYFKRKGEADAYYDFYIKNKHVAFSDYIKVPKSYATVLEQPVKGEIYSYKYQPETAKLYFAMADTYKSSLAYKLNSKELDKNVDIVGKSLVALSIQYRKENNRQTLFSKKALNRKHVCSGAFPFTGRSVISSITGINNTDELVIPWKMALVKYEIHLHSYLYRQGLTPNQVRERIVKAAYWVDPIIDAFFKDMEDNRKSIIQGGRNPSIEYLSLRSFWPIVNRDLEDESIKLPILSVGPYNA